MKFQLDVSDFESWRDLARRALLADVSPEEINFFQALPADEPLLFGSAGSPALPSPVVTKSLRISKPLIDLARLIACHRNPQRFNVLYRVVWRYMRGEPHVLSLATDDDVFELHRMEKAVRRAAHKTKAFVRFRQVADGDHAQFIAWHRPEHPILRLVAPFFARRFPAMRWAILTPDESVSWDLQELTFGSGVPESAAPKADSLDELWKTYYASIFNPARIKLKAMKREMPVRHWRTLPETEMIPDLLADAPRRVAEMVRHSQPAVSAADFLPAERDLPALAAAAAHCEGCELHRRATQTVFGRGSPQAEMVLIGEQPGDMEDLRGEPFVGPAGEVLNEALVAASISRAEVYLTNAVKHFHWEPRGKRRLHRKPPSRAVAACRPWLDAELGAIRPKALVCLGATAAQSVLGRDSRKVKSRGIVFASAACEKTLVTWHPAAILRAPDVADQIQRREELASHLRTALAECRS